MTELEKYKLSVYDTEKVLRQTDTTKVELVRSSLDGELYIRKTYPADKRPVYQCLSNIHDPHIPSVHEVVFGENTVVIEDYVPGKTLGVLLADQYAFSKMEISRIVDGLLDAMDVLHRNNIVHRDIKPENIIVTDGGNPVLIDYSIARIYDQKRSSDTEYFGTVGYAAPEQYGFSQSDFRTDIYSLGVTLQKLLSGQKASAALRAAVLRCTEFDPRKRFASAAAVRKFLRKRKIFGYVIFGLCAAAATVAVVWLLPNSHASTVSPAPSLEQIAPPVYEELPTTSEDVPQPEEPVPQTDEPVPDVQVIPPISSEQNESLVYEDLSNRIVNTGMSREPIPCLQLLDNGTYQAEVLLGEGMSPTEISAEKHDTGCTVTVGGEQFSFTEDLSLSVESYPGGKIYAELIFFDMNGDGIMDILPMVTNAVRTDWDGTDYLLKNYTLGWCLVYDEGEFWLAEGRFLSSYWKLDIYSHAPGCVWGDNMECFRLENGAIVWE